MPQFTLPELPYKYDALEPFIDAKTMEIHHSKHHGTYVTKLNEAIAKHPELESWSIEDLLTKLIEVPEDIRTAVKNHGGGHYNHSFFWNILSVDGQKEPNSPLINAINLTYGDFEKFKEQFNASALGLFGSGWTWLVEDKGEIKIVNTPLQDNPISQGMKPIIGLDVWEHAYYLKHQNKRADYIKDFWNVLDWSKI